MKNELMKNELNESKKILDIISPTMCTAKWMSPSIKLERGITSMCHHTWNFDAGTDPVEEIKKDPHALVNNKRLLQERQDMVNGKKPKACSYCWDVEKLGETSDRIVTSHAWIRQVDVWLQEGWSNPNKINLHTVPKDIEVSFDNTCNLKCMYCNFLYSSKWSEEIRQFGHYPNELELTTNKKNISEWENFDSTPYIEAFWKWFPEISSEVRRIRITGGEPLLSKHTFRLIDYVKKHNPKMIIGINSNFSVPEKNFKRFLNAIQGIENTVHLYASIESYGKKAEYARYGLNYNKFMSNIDTFLSNTKNSRVLPMMTLNALSICSMWDLHEDWSKRIDKFGVERIKFPDSTNYLQSPKLLDARILPNDFINYYKKENDEWNTLYDRFFIRSTSETFSEERKNFAMYINEVDRRRGTSFAKTFPELNELKVKWEE